MYVTILINYHRKDCLSGDVNSEEKIDMKNKGAREEEGERAVKVKKRMDMLASLLTD
jgi:hypothetical protein